MLVRVVALFVVEEETESSNRCYINSNNSRMQRRSSRFFNNLLTAPRTVSDTCAQVARAQSCANYVLHSARFSRATRVTCHAVRRDSSAIR